MGAAGSDGTPAIDESVQFQSCIDDGDFIDPGNYIDPEIIENSFINDDESVRDSGRDQEDHSLDQL